MGLGVFEKIVFNHLCNRKVSKHCIIESKIIPIKVDQVLTHDIGGTLLFLEFEALKMKKIKVNLAVVYCDHNLLQNGFKNADDHRFLRSASAKYGAYFSKPGNGICHQVHLERFAIPGKILLGSDSHTSTCGGIGMVAIGAGGLDVALAIAGNPFCLKMPKIVNVIIRGKLKPFVSAKDIVLYLLKEFGVRGGINKVFEFSGSGILSLSVSERATITNMGAELGATTSIFPSDGITYKFMKLQNRESDWVEIIADKDAIYDQHLEINLDSLEPLISQPHSPDNVVRIRDIAGIKVDQVAIGGCTNSSIEDLTKVALLLRNKKIHPEVSVAMNPGSKQVLVELEKRGLLKYLLAAGIRILEVGCGPCIGIGFSPPTNGVSLRTYNRNFLGRSGTKNAQIYLVSPEAAAAAAITGFITDPRDLGFKPIQVELEEKYTIDDSMILPPSKNPEDIKLIKGPNIGTLPLKEPLQREIKAKIQLKLKDNVTTDDVIPSGADILSLRSNLPKISEYSFRMIDREFVNRMKRDKKGIIVGGLNYGQGSSREHAALAMMYLGIQAVIAKSFSRIHRGNLINSGILPLIFKNEKDFNEIEHGDMLAFNTNYLKSSNIQIKNLSNNFVFEVIYDLNEREKIIIQAGGILPYYRRRQLE